MNDYARCDLAPFDSTEVDMLGYFFDPESDIPMPYNNSWSTVESGNIKLEPMADCSTGSEPSSPEPLDIHSIGLGSAHSTIPHDMLHNTEHTSEMLNDDLDSTESLAPQPITEMDTLDRNSSSKLYSPDDSKTKDSKKKLKKQKRSRKKLKTKGKSEGLKKLSSTADLERYTQALRSTRSLSKEEEQVLKRQRRLIKNRESAQKSRLRKKKYVEELEKKVQLITEENLRLATANTQLTEDIGYLSRIIRTKTPEISDEVMKGLHRKPSVSTKSSKATGLCLLLVLFSFGVFFNSKNDSGSPFGSHPMLNGLVPMPNPVVDGGSLHEEPRFGDREKADRRGDSLYSKQSMTDPSAEIQFERAFMQLKREPTTDDEDEDGDYGIKRKRADASSDEEQEICDYSGSIRPLKQGRFSSFEGVVGLSDSGIKGGDSVFEISKQLQSSSAAATATQDFVFNPEGTVETTVVASGGIS